MYPTLKILPNRFLKGKRGGAKAKIFRNANDLEKGKRKKKPADRNVYMEIKT